MIYSFSFLSYFAAIGEIRNESRGLGLIIIEAVNR